LTGRDAQSRVCFVPDVTREYAGHRQEDDTMTMKKLMAAGAVAIALGACAPGRVLGAEDANAYCAQNNAGRALGMNPFGEDYATWLTYCGDQFRRQAAPAMMFGAQYWQNQQILNRMQQAAPPSVVRCYQQGIYTICE